MSRDRRTLRALLTAAGLFCASLASGCLRPTMVRPSDGPLPQSAPPTEPATGGRLNSPVAISPQPATDLSGNPVAAATAGRLSEAPAASVTQAPPVAPQVGAAPQQLQSGSGPLENQPDAVTPMISAPVNESPSARPTPLLDAAIERVVAVTDEDEPVDEQPKAPGDSTAPKAETPTFPIATLPSTAIVPASDLALPKMPTSAEAHERAPASIDVTKPEPVRVEPDPLGIDKLFLCRKVLGFGSFEALADTRVKAGQRLLVYCEMTGMQYDHAHSEFISRLASKIEIVSIANGTIVWMRELGPAEDVCASRRRDFYVNYRVDLPSSLPTGLYSLRLTQNDLVGERSTSAEIPLEIVP